MMLTSMLLELHLVDQNLVIAPLYNFLILLGKNPIEVVFSAFI